MLSRLQEKQINASFTLENAENRNYQLIDEVGIITYQSKIRPILEHASPVWAAFLIICVMK